MLHIILKKKKEIFAIFLLSVLSILVLYATVKASNTQTVVINEVCSNNFSILQNSSGQYADYIELYNASDFDISLQDWTLHTESELSEFYTFGNIILKPQAYLLLIRNSNLTEMTTDITVTVPSQSVFQLEIPCGITRDGEIIYLQNSANKTVDSVDVPELAYDTVYARGTDSGSSWNIYTPTPGTANDTAADLPPADSIDTPDTPAFLASSLALPSDEYENFSILSLSIPQEYLYGADGIFLPENVGLGGRTYERECQMDFFSPGKNYEFSQKIGIRVSSRSDNLEHFDFNLYARDIYDKNDTFSYDFFGKEIATDKLILKYDATKEHLLLQLLSQNGIATAASTPCILFLNGTFYGEYYLMEPWDESFLANTCDIPETDITLMEDGQLSAGSAYSMQEYAYIVQSSMDSGFFHKEVYEDFCDKVDINSLLDYYTIQIYLNNRNFSPYHDSILWKSETTDSSNSYADGKWRYGVLGLDSTLN